MKIDDADLALLEIKALEEGEFSTVSKLIAHIREQEQEIDNLQAYSKDIESELEDAKNQVDELQCNVTELESERDNLQTQLDELQLED